MAHVVAGHVTRTGTRADVDLQSEFMRDLKDAKGEALKSTRVVRWPRLFEQKIRVAKWIVGRG
jgi:hypothetical protein